MKYATLRDHANWRARQNCAVSALPRILAYENQGLPVTRFWAFVYDLPTDEQMWREFTRDSLLDQLTAQAIGHYHRTARRNLTPILKRIIASDDIFDSEVRAVQAAWREWWERHGESVRIAATTTPMKTQ